jgi:hypothetical protein
VGTRTFPPHVTVLSQTDGSPCRFKQIQFSDHTGSSKDQAAVAADVGTKSFETADIVISGIELAEKIKKGQFKMGKLGGRQTTLPEIWRAALSA